MGLTKTIIIAIIIILAFLAGMLLQSGQLTTKAITEIEPQEETTTMALCNSQSECIDVKITLKDGKVTKIQPASTTRKFPDGWYNPNKTP